jgi:hypothetical protein
MTAEELLKPRFEVLEEYPCCRFKKGDILVRLKHATNNYYHTDENSIYAEITLEEIEKYPHLFKKIKWWEHRIIEDMPKKLICKAIPNDTEVMHIEEWDMKNLYGWTCAKSRTGCGLLNFNYEYGYFPVD